MYKTNRMCNNFCAFINRLSGMSLSVRTQDLKQISMWKEVILSLQLI